MKKYFHSFFICLPLLIFAPCSGQNNGKGSLVSINIESNMKKMEVISLSQLTSAIHYVPFETKDDVFFTPNDFAISDERIMVFNHQLGCFLFDSGGHFISRIGRVGRGPEEYPYITLIGFDNKKKIYIQSLYDLYEFNKEGTFLKKYSKTFRTESIYIYNGFMVNDSLILGHVLNSTGQQRYKALIVNKYGKTKYSFLNFEFFTPKRPGVDGMEGNQTHYYRFNNSIFYKEFFNDTLFSLNEEYKLVPRYAFNLGKFKEPLSSRAKFILERDMKSYLYLSFVYQTEKYIFLNCEFANQFPAKRLTPTVYENSTKVRWYNTTKVIGIFNKKSGELEFCKPTSTDNPLFTSGIYNDIDAGPRFFPTKQVNDSTLAMWIDPKQLKDHVASDDFKNCIPKYPDKKKELEQLANKLSVFDNPVLMFVTFKK